jgi:DNA-binding MarR family transcriptional regulator
MNRDTARDRDRDTFLGQIRALRALEHAAERYRAAFVAKHAVPPSDTLVLGDLQAAGGRLLPRELADRLQLSSGSLTMILDRLEAAGLLMRLPNPTDRRSIYVELNPAGAALLDEAAREVVVEAGSLVPTMQTLIRHLDGETARLTGEPPYP